MSFGAVAAIGGAVIGAAATTSAAKTQAHATNSANALAAQQNAQVRQDLAPWVTSGTNSNNYLARLLGTGGNSTSTGVQNIYQQMLNKANAEHEAKYGVDLDGSTNVEGVAAWKADMLKQAEQQYLANGGEDVTQSADYGSLLKNFTGEDLQNEPGYQFGLAEGQKALDNSAARNGSLFSGAALKAAARYGNDYASTKYNDAYNRDAQNKSRTYSFLSGASSQGQNAAAGVSNAAQNYSNTVGNNLTAQGNASAASTIGLGNALTSGLTNYANNQQQQQWINALTAKNSSPITSGNSGWSAGNPDVDYGQYF